MKSSSISYILLLLVLLAGCATTPKFNPIPQETTAQLKRIAVISMQARKFYRTDFGLLFAHHEQKDISEWGLDKIIEQQIASEVHNTLGLTVVNAPYSAPDFSHVNDPARPFEGSKLSWLNWRAINGATLSYCSTNSLDALLIVGLDYSVIRVGLDPRQLWGPGLYVNGKISQMFFVADIAVLDCKTGEPIAQRFINAPRLNLPDDLSSLSIAQWSDQQSQQIKTDLISLPELSWGYALRSMFLTDDQRNGLGRIGEIVSRIKQHYVDDVPDSKLVTGCRDGINRYLNPTTTTIQSNENRSTNSKSLLLDISDILTSYKQQTPQIDGGKKLNSACLKGMAKGLDRQSEYLDEDDYQELVDESKNGNIGLVVSHEGGSTKITSVIEDSPSEQAGLRIGDVIVKIDLVPTSGASQSEILKLLSGVVGTNITLLVEREGVKGPVEVKLMREVIRIPSMKWQTLAPGFAYIRIAQFSSATSTLFEQAIEKIYLANGGKLKGLVLDLRNNPGGPLTESIAISSAFLTPSTLVAYTTGRTADSNMRLTADPKDYSRTGKTDPLKNLPANIKTVPMVVLVNKATAAGAEIVAAALQDHKRAKIVGTRTFGQGAVATIFRLGDKSILRLTTARMFRPGGVTFNEQGITPDTTIEADKLTPSRFRTMDDIQLKEAVRQLGGLIWFYKD